MKLSEIPIYMKVASTFAQMSYCQLLKVGAIIVKNDSVLSYGYNGTARGDDNVCETDGETNHNVIHAEQNAIYKCAKEGYSCDGATMIITHSPCMRCALAIIQSGIRAVYYAEDYKDVEPIEYLKKKGIPCIKVTMP